MGHSLVARQPIVDAKVRVRGYELLFRGNHLAQGSEGQPGDAATATVAMNALMDIGIETLSGGQPLFVNLTRAFFERELYAALPPEHVVLEVLEDIEPDAAFVDAVRRAREQGYRIALDDFSWERRSDALVELADFVKVDVLGMESEEIARHVEMLRRPGLTLLAEKVETHECFRICREAGYELFQGWFYARPDLVQRRILPGDRLALMHLMSLLQSSHVDFEKIGDLVERNLSLSHKLMRYVNSALFSIPLEIESVRHACTMLGLDRVRVCVTLLLLAKFESKPYELMLNALNRARMCQLQAKSSEAAHRFFTVGLFSLLDAYLDRPLVDLIGEIPLSADVKRAILEQTGEAGLALKTAIACERAEWQTLEGSGQDPDELQRMHYSTLDWTREFAKALGGDEK
jgi:EAL and modified HD-GYP domain-containing signal transduction protein